VQLKFYVIAFVTSAVQIIEKDYKIIIVRPLLGDVELTTIMLVAEVCCDCVLAASCFFVSGALTEAVCLNQELGMLDGSYAFLGTTVSGSLGACNTLFKLAHL
jgi:hypothetical protein